VAREHGLQVEVGRPDAVHAVLAGELPAIDFNRFFARDAPAGKARVSFQHGHGQAAFGQMEPGGQPGQPAADYQRIRTRAAAVQSNPGRR
jgi:hypothetical protein